MLFARRNGLSARANKALGPATPAYTTSRTSRAYTTRPTPPASRLDALSMHLDAGPRFEDFARPSTEQIPPLGAKFRHKTVASPQTKRERLPDWLKTPIPTSDDFVSIKRQLKGLKLHTVCEEARCPNIGECWSGKSKTATIMLMGDTCTRGCRFCAIKTANVPPPLDPNEPENTSSAVSSWNVGYIVLTSVDRDDLPDFGSAHIAKTISLIKSKSSNRILVECLSPDFLGVQARIHEVLDSGLDVFAHNIETVERLTPSVRDRRAKYRQSLDVLRIAKEHRPAILTKTSLMLGVGETDDEVLQTLKDLRSINCDVVTFGQYIQPAKGNMRVKAYIEPAKFEHWKSIADQMGFLYCASGPLVRSSYKAGEFFLASLAAARQSSQPAPAVPGPL